MGKRLSKSRTFAVVLTKGGNLEVKFLWMVTDKDSGEETLEDNNHLTPWIESYRDTLIEMLVKGGLSVRFYDSEEKIWLEHSLLHGYNAAPGSRDGQYAPPTLDEFKEDYLLRN